MKLNVQKRLAARVLGVGINRVWIDPTRAEEVSAAITREDIKRLIHAGVIRARPERSISRGRARERSAKRRKGKRRGMGSRKGAAGARAPRKQAWIKRVRALRAKLSELREKGAIDAKEYRRLYRMIKGGAFRSKAHLESYLKERGMLRE